MAKVISFLTRTRGQGKLHWTDWLTYGYLFFGVMLMFLPVIWLGLSSFKTDAELERFPPRILPMAQETATVEGYDDPLPLFTITGGEYAGQTLAQIRRIGLNAQMVDPANPGERLNVGIDDREPIEHFALATENYTELFDRFNFLRFFWNSVFITTIATAIMLTVNSMAAFALSKYQFKGRMVVLGLVIGTLMIPQTVVLVPLFLITKELNMADSLWGVIIPGAATPTGVFLLRQYMLTIPDEILDAARMDKASDGRSSGGSLCHCPPPPLLCSRSSRSCGAGMISCGR